MSEKDNFQGAAKMSLPFSPEYALAQVDESLKVARKELDQFMSEVDEKFGKPKIPEQYLKPALVNE